MASRLSTEQRAALWTHLSQTILDLPPDGADITILTMAGYSQRPENLSSISDTELASLAYRIGENQPPRSLTSVAKVVFRVFRSYIQYAAMSGDPILPAQYIDITVENIEIFRSGVYMTQYLTNNPPPAANTSATSASSAYTKAAIFKKGMKRDPTIYPTLKNDAGWDYWQRVTCAAAATQDCALVFDYDDDSVPSLNPRVDPPDDSSHHSVTSFVDRLVHMSHRQHTLLHDMTVHAIPVDVDDDELSVDLSPCHAPGDAEPWSWDIWRPELEVYNVEVIPYGDSDPPEDPTLVSAPVSTDCSPDAAPSSAPTPSGTRGTRPITQKPSTHDYDKLRPLFAWQKVPTIKRTFELTTQHARIPNSEILKVHYKSPNPATNVHRRNEDIDTDTIFSDVPAKHTFPSDSPEKKGNIVGIAEHCGHLLTYKVLTQDTLKVIYRSDLRPVRLPNKRADYLRGEDFLPPEDPVVKSRTDYTPESPPVSNEAQPTTPVFNPEDLVGRSFLIDQDDGTRKRATITEVIEDHQAKVERHADRLKFKIAMGNDDFNDLLTYQQVLDHITRDEESSVMWKFKRIVRHQGPLKRGDKFYKGSTWNVEIEWENGEITIKLLTVIAADDPVTCAIYAKENDLLHLPGWKRFKTIAGRHKKYLRMVKQAKLRSYRTAPKYMFGFEIPRDYNHAVQLDKANGNTKWQDCTALELLQMKEYQVFLSLGKGAAKPPGYKQIRVHFVYAVKHDGRHKARLVADGHLTDVPLESVYSGVVSLRAFKIVAFLSQHNDMELWSTDIGNAYLEAKTKEKLVIVAGPEFGKLQGHMLVIQRALYGLRTSGLRWHERFSQVLCDLGFFPCKAEPGVWMRDK
jgi:hypothetical protein